MIRAVVAIELDGLDTNVIATQFEVSNREFDLK